MNTARKIIVILAATFLPLMLITFGSFAATYRIIGQPEPIEKALAKSGVYSTFVQSGLDQIQKNAGEGDIPLDNPEIRAVIEQAIPPAYLQQQTNGVLDNFFAWLQGRTPTFQFEINLQEVKTNLANGLAGYASSRIDTLPVCTTADEMLSDVDPFNATCVPPGFDKTAAVQKVRDSIANSQDFLADPIISSNDLSINTPQAVQLGSFRITPAMYAQTKLFMYISGGLAALLALLIIVLSASKRRGVRIVAITDVSVGALYVIVAAAVGLTLNAISQRLSGEQNSQALQTSLLEAVRLLVQVLRNWWLVYGLSLVVAGVVALLVLLLAKRRKAVATQPNNKMIPKQ